MEFCPLCGMLLQVEPPNYGRRSRLFCPTCPYVCPIVGKIVKKERLKKKEIEPILSGTEAFKFAPKTQATCPQCQHGEAYFKQVQMRSADEPMTTFYRCCNEKCQCDWRDE